MDARDIAAERGDWFESFDEEKMILAVTLVDDEDNEFMAEFPAKYGVCSLCDGKGKHVNPSIDSHGISAEEFYDDLDFAEDYVNGVYDVACNQCHGKRVYPEVEDENDLSEDQKKNLKLLHEKWQADADYIREIAYERRMGF